MRQPCVRLFYLMSDEKGATQYRLSIEFDIHHHGQNGIYSTLNVPFTTPIFPVPSTPSTKILPIWVSSDV